MKLRCAICALGLAVCLIGGFAPFALSQTRSSAGLPQWVSSVGSRNVPSKPRVFSASKLGATADGVTDSTSSIQRAIDTCSKSGGGIVTLDPGSYVTGAIFLKNNVELRI